MTKNPDIAHPDYVVQERFAQYRERLALSGEDPQEFIFRTARGVDARNKFLNHVPKRTDQDQNGVLPNTTVI